MIHHSRWHGTTRALRGTRLAAPVGLLLACLLIAALPTAASATTPDVRGEWTLVVNSAAGTLHGKSLITEGAKPEGKFAAHTTVWENVIAGSFTGTLEGATATVKTTSAAAPPVLPEGEFNSNKMAVEVGVGTLALSGEGTLKLGASELPATLVATRIKTYQEVQERELKERELKEKEEREAREKKEKEEREVLEAKEKKEAAERTAREQQEQAKHEKELKERQEREAREAAERAAAAKTTTTLPPVLVSVGLVAKTLTLGNGGAISLDLTNPNASPVHGQLKLTLAKAGKTSSAKHTTSGGTGGTLGTGSFSIAAHGSEIVKVKLSQSGRTQLARHKTLHVVVTLTTQASGQPDAGKTYSLTLHAAKPAHGKH